MANLDLVQKQASENLRVSMQSDPFLLLYHFSVVFSLSSVCSRFQSYCSKKFPSRIMIARKLHFPLTSTLLNCDFQKKKAGWDINVIFAI